MSATKITTLQKEDLDQAIQVFLTAFETEAFMKALIDLSRQKNYDRYAQIVKYKLLLYLETGQNVFAARAIRNNREEIAGLFILKSPRIMLPLGLQLRRIIPYLPALAGLLPFFLRAAHLAPAVKAPENLPGNHYILEGLAVHPAFQGKGLGRLMLEKADRICSRDSGASGIYLYTGDEKNKNMYQHLDYQVLKAVPTRQFTSYHMFKKSSSCRAGVI